MVRVKQEAYEYDVKSHLVIDTCNIYQNSHFPCVHINGRSASFAIQSPLIDWYLILRVGEDASIKTIRKQYHKLALLLHPDKNKHPNAEFAFKLISQAYKCLSDDARRRSFNLERWRNQCTKCIKNPQKTHYVSFHPQSQPTHNAKKVRNSPNSSKHSTSYKILQHLRVIRDQLKEEARVIESCISINRHPKNEYPVFDPSSYTRLGYPHIRNHHHPYCKTVTGASSEIVQRRNVVISLGQRRGRYESPVFELRTGYNSLNVTPSVHK